MPQRKRERNIGGIKRDTEKERERKIGGIKREREFFLPGVQVTPNT